MSLLDKIQSNLNLLFKLVKGYPGYDLCWFCQLPFEDVGAKFCEACQTFCCPHCFRCYCNLTEEAKLALDSEMFSVGLWSPYGNPPKRKRRKH